MTNTQYEISQRDIFWRHPYDPKQMNVLKFGLYNNYLIFIYFKSSIQILTVRYDCKKETI